MNTHKEDTIYDDILLTSKEVFGDDEEHLYIGTFTDGSAMLQVEEYTGKPLDALILVYPTIDEVLADDDMVEEVLVYNGLFDCTADDINPYDIAMVYGNIKTPQQMTDELGEDDDEQ